jgi:hypothetical protein
MLFFCCIFSGGKAGFLQHARGSTFFAHGKQKERKEQDSGEQLETFTFCVVL